MKLTLAGKKAAFFRRWLCHNGRAKKWVAILRRFGKP